jgi:NADP-dependent 3-hydroxy acid dehydrogenase YdfG
MTNSARPDGPAVDPRHLLVIGAGPASAGAIAHRFAQGGYHLTLLARRTDGLAKLASDLASAACVPRVGPVRQTCDQPKRLRFTAAAAWSAACN